MGIGRKAQRRRSQVEDLGLDLERLFVAPKPAVLGVQGLEVIPERLDRRLQHNAVDLDAIWTRVCFLAAQQRTPHHPRSAHSVLSAIAEVHEIGVGRVRAAIVQAR